MTISRSGTASDERLSLTLTEVTHLRAILEAVPRKGSKRLTASSAAGKRLAHCLAAHHRAGVSYEALGEVIGLKQLRVYQLVRGTKDVSVATNHDRPAETLGKPIDAAWEPGIAKTDRQNDNLTTERWAASLESIAQKVRLFARQNPSLDVHFSVSIKRSDD